MERELNMALWLFMIFLIAFCFIVGGIFLIGGFNGLASGEDKKSILWAWPLGFVFGFIGLRLLVYTQENIHF